MTPYPPFARSNHFRARVCAIVEAPVVSAVEMALPGGLVLDATIATRQIDELKLEVGGEVLASVQADDVSIALV
jgi:molybdopterin-binding protein